MAHETNCRIPDYIQFYLISGYVGRSSVCPMGSIARVQRRHVSLLCLGRNVNPGTLSMALQNAVQDRELSQAIDELWVLDCAAGGRD